MKKEIIWCLVLLGFSLLLISSCGRSKSRIGGKEYREGIIDRKFEGWLEIENK